MNERKYPLSFVMAIGVIMLLAGIATGVQQRNAGRAEMKRWQDSYYAAHPVVKEVPVTPTINGAQSWIIRPGEECVVISFDSNKQYNAVCKPAPAPPAKPAKGSERPQAKCSQLGTGPNPCMEGTPLSAQPIPEKEPRQLTINSPTVDWAVKLEPCEGGIYRFHRNTGIIECEPSVPAVKP